VIDRRERPLVSTLEQMRYQSWVGHVFSSRGRGLADILTRNEVPADIAAHIAGPLKTRRLPLPRDMGAGDWARAYLAASTPRPTSQNRSRKRTSWGQQGPGMSDSLLKREDAGTHDVSHGVRLPEHSTRRPRPDGRPQTRRYLCRVLRRFIYLDRTALDQYVTALEGGRTTESTTRLVRTGTGAGGFDAKLVSASGEKSREEEESRTLADTDEARFDRLLRAAASQPEVLGWTEVMQPDTDLAGIGLGAMLAWEWTGR